MKVTTQRVASTPAPVATEPTALISPPTPTAPPAPAQPAPRAERAAVDPAAATAARARMTHDPAAIRAQHAMQEQVANTPAPVAPSAAVCAPTRTYDVSTVSEADLASLRRGSEVDRRTANTISNARTNYADVISRGGRVVVNNSPSNGGQPVLTLVPPGFDPSRPARVHTHYHGFNGSVGDGPTPGTRRFQNINEVMARDPQTVMVLPECSNAPTRGWGNSYQSNWSNVRSQAQTTEDALCAAGVSSSNVSQHVVSAHSNGGNALHQALTNTPGGAGVRADRLELYDCFYGNWDNTIRDFGATPNGAAVREVAYYHGTNSGSRAGREREFGAAFPGRFTYVESNNHNHTVRDNFDILGQ